MRQQRVENDNNNENFDNAIGFTAVAAHTKIFFCHLFGKSFFLSLHP